MTNTGPALVTVLAEIRDFRQAQGQRHPLGAILSLAVAAMLCGYRSYSAMAEWGRNYGVELLRALGFSRDQAPCAATFYNVLGGLGRDEFESKLAAWAEAVIVSEAANGAPTAAEPLACDGKTLRGSRKQGAPGAHLLSVVSQRLGLSLWQQAVQDKTNEITAMQRVLQELMLKGRILTVDALLAQREIAQTIINQEGDYVMVIKGNQPSLHQQLQALFDQVPASLEVRPSAQTVESGHGRVEVRRLTASTSLTGYSDWPGLAQVFALERTVTQKKTGQVRHEIVYGVTSLSPTQADAAQLLSLVRGHWVIENQLHWVRDVTFDEDRSQVRCGSVPQVMAALRNTAISLLRLAGETNIAAACRRLAAQPWQALALLGIQPTIK